MRGQSRDLFFQRTNKRTWRSRTGRIHGSQSGRADGARSIKLGTTARAKPSVRSGPARRDRQPTPTSRLWVRRRPVRARRVGVSADGTRRRWGSGEVGPSAQRTRWLAGDASLSCRPRGSRPRPPQSHPVTSRTYRRFLSFCLEIPVPGSCVFCACFGSAYI